MNIDTSEYYGGTYPDPPEYEEEDNTYDEWDLAGWHPNHFRWTKESAISNVIGGVMTPPYAAVFFFRRLIPISLLH